MFSTYTNAVTNVCATGIKPAETSVFLRAHWPWNLYPAPTGIEVYAAPQFLGNVERQNEFLRDLWIECDFGGSMDSVLAAWYDHVLRKRKGEVAKRLIADVMIGAYALSKGGLITRNEDDFRSLYPTLEIFNPAAGGEAAR